MIDGLPAPSILSPAMEKKHTHKQNIKDKSFYVSYWLHLNHLFYFAVGVKFICNLPSLGSVAQVVASQHES